MAFGEQDNKERFCGLVCWCGACALRGPGKGGYADIPGACYFRGKKTTDRLTKVKTGLCQGSYMPRL